MSLPREFLPPTRMRKTELTSSMPAPALNCRERLANLKRPVTMSTYLPSSIHFVGTKELATNPLSTKSMSVGTFRAQRYKAEGFRSRATNSAAIIGKDELTFVQSMTRI